MSASNKVVPEDSAGSANTLLAPISAGLKGVNAGLDAGLKGANAGAHALKKAGDKLITTLRLKPHQKLMSDPKARQRSINAVVFAVFIDCLCSAVLRPNYPAMIGMDFGQGPHPEHFPYGSGGSDADPKMPGGIKPNLAQYLLPGCTAVGTLIAGMVI